MCLIITTENKNPSPKVLENAYQNNPDGIGIAFLSNQRKNGSTSSVKRVYWEKGVDLDPKDLLHLINNIVPPYIIHFRLATVGYISDQLCHPFPVTKRVGLGTSGWADKVLMHNGHWTGWRDKALSSVPIKTKKIPKGDWSDSRAIAWLNLLYGNGFLTLLGERVATLNRKGITRYGSGWIEKRGVWYSNNSGFDKELACGGTLSQGTYYSKGYGTTSGVTYEDDWDMQWEERQRALDEQDRKTQDGLKRIGYLEND